LRSTGTITHTDSRAPYLGQRFYRASQLTGTNIVTGDHVPTSAGDIVIHPITHASFVMQWNGMMIYNDPDGAASLYAGLPLANLILVSHGHGDHFDQTTLAAVRGPTVAIVAPPTVRTSMNAALQAVTTPLANGESATLIGITIEAVPAYNNNHPRGTGMSGNGYVLTIGGKRIYIAGDTGDVAEMRALTNIDVAFLPMNAPTMTITQAASAVRAFQPRVVYPYHYGSGGIYSDLTSFRQMVGTDQGVEVRRRIWYPPSNARGKSALPKRRAHAHLH
jgi:L-ascorbate metabolism protein UlaG (beta-lactamase superfamily)